MSKHHLHNYYNKLDEDYGCKSRAYVNKVLQGNVNFTIESLVKIARALDHKFGFQFVPERATERDNHLAETWQKGLRAPAFAPKK